MIAGHRHRIHGLTVSAPVRLAAGPATGTSSPDVVFAVGRGPARPPRGIVLARHDDPATNRRHMLVSDQNGWCLALGGALRAEIRTEESVVSVTVAGWVPDDLLSLLLTGPVLTSVCLARGTPLLHASAVVVDEEAWGFVGGSGTGKSTLARLLCRLEHPLFSDDALRVDVGVRRITAHRGTTSSRLRTGQLLEDDPNRAMRSADGRHVLRDTVTAPDHVPVAAMVLPLLSPHFSVVRAMPCPAATALPLVASAHVLEGICAPELLRSQFALAGQVVSEVPVVRLEVPWGQRPVPPSLAIEVQTAVNTVLAEAMAPERRHG